MRHTWWIFHLSFSPIFPSFSQLSARHPAGNCSAVTQNVNHHTLSQHAWEVPREPVSQWLRSQCLTDSLSFPIQSVTVAQEARKLKDMLIQGAGASSPPANVALYACRLRVPLRNLTGVSNATCWIVEIISIDRSQDTATVDERWVHSKLHTPLANTTYFDCASPEWNTTKQ